MSAQKEIDQATYYAWLLEHRKNDTATARALGIARSTVAARVIRFQRRVREMEIRDGVMEGAYAVPEESGR